MRYDTVEYLVKQVVLEYSVPIIIINKQRKIIYPHNFKKDLGDFNIYLLKYFKENKIVLIEGDQKVYAVFSAYIEEKKCSVLLGPFYTIQTNFGESKNEYLLDYIKLQRRRNSRLHFINLAKYIFSFLNDKIPPKEILVKQFTTEETHPFSEIFQKNLESRRKNDLENDSTEIERRVIQSIIDNDRDEFEWLFSKVSTTYFIRLHSDRLTSLKYKFVALMTLLTRVSINNGVDIKKAYSLSDSLIQTLESIVSLQECISYLKESCLQFMDLIYISKIGDQNLLVREIKEYIATYIDQKITIDLLAKHFEKSTSYISSEFKKYTGVTIHAYILTSKIEEVKRLLVETDLDISSIAQKLEFSDQSHLYRVFKRAGEMTPKEYRKKYQTTKVL